MPDFYSKRHLCGNRTYKGILSREECEQYISDNHEVTEVNVYTSDNSPVIVYFTDDRTSNVIFGIDNNKCTPSSTSTPLNVSPRIGVEDGEVDTLEKYLIVFHNTETLITPEIVVWSYEEFLQAMDEFSCKCGNPEYGFDCVCDHVRNNPGDIEFSCEFCGIFSASKPRCNKCESE